MKQFLIYSLVVVLVAGKGLLSADAVSETFVFPGSQERQEDLASNKSGTVNVLIYHRFAEDTLPSTNVRLDQFENHIRLIQKGKYELLDTKILADKLSEKAPLPSQGLVLTVDDAYRSFMEKAWPRLKAANIPVTLFVATDPVSKAGPDSNYLTWDDIRTLVKEGVTIGHHGAAHLHLPRVDFSEAIEDIRKANEVFERELGFVPDIFAYPYGEYDNDLKKWLQENGFRLAFAQYSSATNTATDRFAIPRFPVNERYGEEDRFLLVTRAKALPVRHSMPDDPQIRKSDSNPPVLNLEIAEMAENPDRLICYPSHMDTPADVTRISGVHKVGMPDSIGAGPAGNREAGAEGTVLEIRFEKTLPPGRSRINCTLPSSDGRWYWYGRPFFVPGGTLD